MSKQILLRSGESKAIIDVIGFKILELILDNQKILREFKRGDSKVASSHPCSPIFGPETNTKYGLPQHGFVRDRVTEITKQSNTSLELAYTFEDEYPATFELSQEFNLTNNNFSIKTVHTNLSNKPAPLHFGEHFYFSAPSGYKGTKINNQDISSLIANDKEIKLQKENIINIPSLPGIKLEQTDLPIAQLWVGKNENTNLHDSNYVCIEPTEAPPRQGFFGSETSILPAKQERVNFISLTI